MSNSICSSRVPNTHPDPNQTATRVPLRVHTRNDQQISQRPKIQAVYILRELLQDRERNTDRIGESFPRYL